MKKSLSVGNKIFLENSQENGPKEKKREKRGDRKKIWAEVQESIQKEEPNDSPEVPRQEEGQQCTSPGLPSGDKEPFQDDLHCLRKKTKTSLNVCPLPRR